MVCKHIAFLHNMTYLAVVRTTSPSAVIPSNILGSGSCLSISNTSYFPTQANPTKPVVIVVVRYKQRRRRKQNTIWYVSVRNPKENSRRKKKKKKIFLARLENLAAVAAAVNSKWDIWIAKQTGDRLAGENPAVENRYKVSHSNYCTGSFLPLYISCIIPVKLPVCFLLGRPNPEDPHSTCSMNIQYFKK